LLCVLVLGLVSTVSAEEKTWKLPKLNPFSKKGSGRATARIADESPGRFSLPKLSLPKVNLWPKRSAAPARKSGGPSALTKLNRSSKQLLAKTKRAVTPWTWSSDRKKKPTSSSARVARARGDAPTGSRQPFYSGLFARKPEPKKIESVNDWLALPRPSP
jgi:hypothetical protein